MSRRPSSYRPFPYTKDSFGSFTAAPLRQTGSMSSGQVMRVQKMPETKVQSLFKKLAKGKKMKGGML